MNWMDPSDSSPKDSATGDKNYFPDEDELNQISVTCHQKKPK